MLRYSSDRRAFLQSLTAAGVVALTPPAWSMTKSPVGVQLFTLRTEVADDLPGTLAAVRKIGFQQVEAFAGMYALPAAELRKIIEDAGLTCPSAHFRYETLEDQLQYARELGVTYVVCAMLPKSLWSREGFIEAASRFNLLGSKAKSMGLKLAFHNHNFEFQQLPPRGSASVNGLTVLMQNTDPSLVSWEEDCYWVAQGGADPLALLKHYAQRIPLLHLKDRLPGAPVTFTPGKESQFFTEIGTGNLPWLSIVKAAQASDALLFIEQDATKVPPLESLAVSYRNLQRYLRQS